ncbi:simple sugar transport system ATP-binding protein [Albimonas donghaensis]|uniref:Simple sugar transport system ATP-binding protein n=1 Tax=Albimonas donghaensis TaxID=356660 RepID=A0A1H3AMW4_9RHOB|nr:simple sugar transport system ATP-binding protein [Albimonas donghaensis]
MRRAGANPPSSAADGARGWDRARRVRTRPTMLDEIRALSDRVLVMFDGRVMGELPGDAGEREIGLLMSGVEKGEAA